MNKTIRALLLAAAFAGCSPLAPASPMQAQQLNVVAPRQLTDDPELRGIVRQVSAVTPEGLGFRMVVTIDGKEWSDRNRSQQDRVLQKIAVQMRSALHSVQSGPPYNTFSAQLVNDLGSLFGFVLVGGVDDGITYRANR